MMLSVIIPVFNEKDTVLEVIRRAKEAPLQDGVGREIIVVNDGSTDGTSEQLKNVRTDGDIRIFHLPSNSGKTAAVKFGIEKASGDMVIIQDADLEYSPDHYRHLLQPILDQRADVVYGSRFLGQIENMTFINRTANRISNMTVNLLFKTGLTDFHTCYKLFRRDIIKDLPITSRKFTFDTEVTVRLIDRKCRILEIPIHYTARRTQDGKKITWAQALESYLFLLKFWFITAVPRRLRFSSSPA